MTRETETIDRLFLELSQFTKAKTAKEIALESEIARLREQAGAETIYVLDVSYSSQAYPDNDDVAKAMSADCESSGMGHGARDMQFAFASAEGRERAKKRFEDDGRFTIRKTYERRVEQSAPAPADNWKIDRDHAIGVLTDACALCDGWHCDTCWTEWDEKVRQGLSDLLHDLYGQPRVKLTHDDKCVPSDNWEKEFDERFGDFWKGWAWLNEVKAFIREYVRGER